MAEVRHIIYGISCIGFAVGILGISLIVHEGYGKSDNDRHTADVKRFVLNPNQLIMAYWSDWTHWECSVSHSLTFLIRYRNCSDKTGCQGDNHELNYCDKQECPQCYSQPDIISNRNVKSDIGSVWSQWGEWHCTILNDVTSLTRSRNCLKLLYCMDEYDDMHACTKSTCPQCFDSSPPSPTGSSINSKATVLNTMPSTFPATNTPTRTPITTTASGSVSHTIAPTPTQCAVCVGPPELCEQLYRVQVCNYPDNYCINHVKNFANGHREISRGCGNHATCYREWFQGSSDSDKCRTFKEDFIYTLAFECTYCCIKDECNLKLVPDLDTLYNDV